MKIPLQVQELVLGTFSFFFLQNFRFFYYFKTLKGDENSLEKFD